MLINGSTAEEAAALARDILSALSHLRAAGLTGEDIAHLGAAFCKSGVPPNGCARVGRSGPPHGATQRP